jgi:hypothetical protein
LVPILIVTKKNFDETKKETFYFKELKSFKFFFFLFLIIFIFNRHPVAFEHTKFHYLCLCLFSQVPQINALLQVVRVKDTLLVYTLIIEGKWKFIVFFPPTFYVAIVYTCIFIGGGLNFNSVINYLASSCESNSISFNPIIGSNCIKQFHFSKLLSFIRRLWDNLALSEIFHQRKLEIVNMKLHFTFTLMWYDKVFFWCFFFVFTLFLYKFFICPKTLNPLQRLL